MQQPPTNNTKTGRTFFDFCIEKPRVTIVILITIISLIFTLVLNGVEVEVFKKFKFSKQSKDSATQSSGLKPKTIDQSVDSSKKELVFFYQMEIESLKKQKVELIRGLKNLESEAEKRIIQVNIRMLEMKIDEYGSTLSNMQTVPGSNQ